MKTLINLLYSRFPGLWIFIYRTATRILRRFPYRPAHEDGGIVNGPEWLIVRPSLISNAGNGLFTTRYCPAGTVLCEYTGTRLTGLQLLRTPDWTYVYNVHNEYWIDAQDHPGVKARYINDNFDHSKTNVLWVQRDGRIFMEAARDVLPGEELYAQYGQEYWDNHEYWK